MKNVTIFFIISILNTQYIHAQFGKQNQQLIGGSFNLNTSANKTAPNFTSQQKNGVLGIGISYGKFIKKNTLSIFTINLMNSVQKNMNTTTEVRTISNILSAGYKKVYFKEIAKNWFAGIGVGGNILFQTMAQKNIPNPIQSKNYDATMGLTPILSYQISNRFIVNIQPSTSFLNVNYQYGTVSDNTGILTKSNSLSLDAGFFNSPLNNLSIGFYYLLKNKIN